MRFLMIVLKPVVRKGLKKECGDFPLWNGVTSVFRSSAFPRKKCNWKNGWKLVFFKKNVFDWQLVLKYEPGCVGEKLFST